MIGGYSSIDKWVGRQDELKNSLGCEYFRKFSNEYGDYMTADLQVRLTYDSLDNSREAWALEIHNAWLEYILGLGSKLRVGHFDPEFGLEPVLDTHATLFQTLAMQDIGFKKDWGLEYKGLLGDFDYAVAAQLGSGMSIRSRDNSHLITARLGSSNNPEFKYGFSLLYGRTLMSEDDRTIPLPDLMSDETILKKRLGLDAQYLTGPYTFKSEVAYGEDDDKEVAGLLLETDYVVPSMQNLQFELQGKSWSGDIHDDKALDFTLGCGLTYKFNPSFTTRLGYFHDVYSAESEKDRRVVLQFYFYWL